MKSSLKPTFTKYIRGNYILWFEKSNQYVIASNFLYHLINTYLTSKSPDDFISKAADTSDSQQASLIYEELSTFLIEANSVEKEGFINANLAKSINDSIAITPHYYSIDKNFYQLNFTNHSIFNLIKERLAQFEISKPIGNFTTFDFKIAEGMAYLEKEGKIITSYPVSKMHFLFGKFSMELISNLYSFPTNSWLATLHASTVCDENQAIMLVGESGNGKSTLAGLCLLNGISLLADDFTPLSSKDLKLYKNPSAISIKKGAFSEFKAIPSNLSLTEAKINPKKNIKVKYLQDQNLDLTNASRPCQKIVYVKYCNSPNQELINSTSDKILQTLIPDSWISPKKEHAESFLNWISQCQFYELNYHENQFAIDQVKALFKIPLS